MTEVNQVFAIIDAQGFFIEDIFYPREVAIVNSDQQIVFEIFTNIPIETQIRCFKQICFQQDFLHGLSLSPMLSEETRRIYYYSELKGIVKFFYDKYATEEKFKFGVKNKLLLKWLNENGFPAFDLEEEIIFGETCPPLSVFEKFKNSIYCPIHAKRGRKINHESCRCALRKAWVIWDWLLHKLKTEELIDAMSNLSLRDIRI